MRVVVHHFRVYDAASDSWIVPSRKSPVERIERIRGTIIAGTAEEVDRSALDEHDRYDPQARLPEPERSRLLH